MPSCTRPARRDVVRRLLFTVFVALSLPATVRPAHADDPFVAASVAWSGPGGSAGVANQGTQIWVDAFPDGLEGAGDTYHPVPALIDASWTLSLSPSRRNLIATIHDGPACNGGSTRIRVFVIPPTSTALSEPGSQQTLVGCLNPTLFFDSGAPAALRTALFREVGTSSYDPHYLWWNLDTGERATSAFAFLYPSGFVEFAPSGTMAFVQHDVNGAHGGGTNYSLIDLCPAQIGQASQPGIENASVLHAWVVPGSPATVAYRTEAGATVGGAAYVDCSTSAPLGACCMPDGSCSDLTQAECTGTWHPEGLCAQVACPGVSLGVSMTGPATVERGQPVTYTLTASNTGALSSSGVVVTDRIPTGSSFVSATAGGTYSAGTSTVTWTIGTLGAGQQAALGLTVLAPCSGSSLVNNTYSISGTPGGTVAGSPTVTTTLTAPSTTGLSLTLLSQALDATPLQTGGRVRHTIRLVNSLASIRRGINFSVAPGTVARLLQVVNAGGGSATLIPSSLTWTGDLPASSTTDVVYDTEITECRSIKPAVEIINWGNVVSVRNACAQLVTYSVPTQSFAVAGSPFELRLESPGHGPVQAWTTYSGQESRLIACRPGATVNMQLRIINRSNLASVGTSVSLPLPFGASPAAEPPFLYSQPAGTQWNSALRTITWDGVIPANDSLIIRFLVLADSGVCARTLVASGTLGTCANLLRSTLSLLQVPVPPAPHLLALQTHEGLAY
ncbi:MAG: DUF11 domain-containing protein, partial [Candidatus Eisenbacteria bacterium]|nr:DUF11 domain-containing protein [Candidatus Eisenbacteria bacterium]